LCSEVHLELWVFPSARKECTRDPKKNVKSRISRARKKKVPTGTSFRKLKGIARNAKGNVKN